MLLETCERPSADDNIVKGGALLNAPLRSAREGEDPLQGKLEFSSCEEHLAEIGSLNSVGDDCEDENENSDHLDEAGEKADELDESVGEGEGDLELNFELLFELEKKDLGE